MASNKLTQQEIKNIQETGPVGLKGIRNTDLYKGQPVDPLRQASNLNKQTKSGSPFYSAQAVATPQRTSNFSLGQSVYDDNITVAPTDSSIQDTRAENQSWVTQLANGIGKGVITAGTTFIDGTVGAITGLATMGARQFQAATGEKQYTSGEIWSGFWDNPITNAMDAITKMSEEMLPNYYTTQGESENFDFGSMNFWADKIIKNLGFTVGALYSGAVWSKPISALGKAVSESNKLQKIFGITKKALEVAGTEGKVATTALNNEVQGLVGAITGAFGEGSIEALNTKNDFVSKNMAKLDAEYNDRISRIKAQYGDSQDAQYLLEKEKNAYEKTKAKINEDAVTAGNVDLVANLGILTTSNFLQFAKMWGGGFRTNSWALNIKRLANGTYDKLGKGTIVKAGLKPIISEGSEEALQQYASDVPTRYYTKEVENYYKANTNRKAETETNNMLTAMTDQFIDTFSSGNTWEQFLIGGLTGALGMPMYRGKSFSYNGGIWNEVKDAKNLRERYNHVSDYLNDRVGNKEALQKYYKGLIRNRTYANTMQKAVEDGDKKLYLDSEFAQLFSDINMFDEAGRMEDLKALINATIPQSEEDINALIELTSSKDLDEQEKQQVEEKNKQAAQIKTKIQDIDNQIAEETKNAEAQNEDIANNQKIQSLNQQKESLKAQLTTISNDISSIYKNSKKPWIGPYIDDEGNKKSSQEVQEEIQKQADKFNNVLNSYSKHKGELKQLFNGRFNSLDEENEILGELNFRHAQIDNWNQRVQEMSETLNKKLQTAISNLLLNVDDFDNSNLNKFISDRISLLEEDLKELDKDSDEYKATSKELDSYKELLDKDKGKEKREAFIKELEELKGKSSEEFNALLRNPNKTSQIASLLLSQENGLEEVDRLNTAQLYKDTASLNKSINMYNSKLIEYLTNISSLQNEHTNIDNENKQKQSKQEKQELNNKLLNSSLFDINNHINTDLNGDYDKYLKDDGLSQEAKDKVKKARKLQEAINILNKLLQKKVEDGAFPQETADAIKNNVLNSAKKADSIDDILDITSELYQFDPLVENQLSEEDFNNLQEETSKLLFETSKLLEEGEETEAIHEVAAAEQDGLQGITLDEDEKDITEETNEAATATADTSAIEEGEVENAEKEVQEALNAQNPTLDEEELNAGKANERQRQKDESPNLSEEELINGKEAEAATKPELDEGEQRGFSAEQQGTDSNTTQTKGIDPVEQPKPISDSDDALNTVGTDYKNSVRYLFKNCITSFCTYPQIGLNRFKYKFIKLGNLVIGYDIKTSRVFLPSQYIGKNPITNQPEFKYTFTYFDANTINKSPLIKTLFQGIQEYMGLMSDGLPPAGNKKDILHLQTEKAISFSQNDALKIIEEEALRLLSKPDIQDTKNKEKESPIDTEEDKKDINERVLNPIKSKEQSEKDITKANKSVEDNPSQNTLSSQASQESEEAPISSIYDYWRSNTSEYKIHRERGDDAPYYEVSKNPVHKAIHEFLKKHGVFDRINNHSYKPKDKVRFAFSKSLNEKAGTPVLLAIDENGQIVADLPNPKDINFFRCKGLKEFYDKYSNIVADDTSENDLVIIPNVTSSIAKCLIGKPHYLEINKRNTLNDIASTQTSQGTKQNPPKIGVALMDENGNTIIRMDGTQKRGARNLEERKVLNPIDVEQGQPFLLIETSDPLRKYYPVPISMRYYQSQANTTLDRIATELLENLPSPSNVLEWKKKFRQIFNVQNVTVNFNKEGKVRNVAILKQGEKDWIFLQNPKDIENKEVPFNIDYRLLGSKNAFGTNLDYNSIIGEVAQTNLGKGEHYTINDWVIINPIIEETEQKAKSPKGKSKEELLRERANKAQEAGNLRKATNATNHEFDINNFKIVTINLSGYNYLYNMDLEKGAIVTKEGKIIPIEDKLEEAKTLKDIEKQIKIYRTLTNLYIIAHNINVDDIKEDFYHNKIISTPFGYYNLTKREIVTRNQYKQYTEDVASNPSNYYDVHTYSNANGDFKMNYAVNKDGSKRILNFNYKGKTYTLRAFEDEVLDEIVALSPEQEFAGRTFYSTEFGTYSFYDANGKFDLLDLKTAQMIEAASNQTAMDSIEEDITSELEKQEKEETPNETAIDRDNIIAVLSKQAGNNAVINSILKELSNESIELLNKTNVSQAVNVLKQLKALNRTLKTKEAKDKFIQTKLGKKHSLVSTSNNTTAPIDLNKEVSTLIKMLPQLTKDNAIKIVEGLIKTTNGDSYGTFYKGIITLSNQAVSGTAYHEGFHYVFNTLYNSKERQSLLERARKEFGNLSELELEEKLAENFADFVQTQESLVEDKGIKSFFKELWNLITILFNNKIYIDNAFRNIYKGKYAQQNVNTITVEELAKQATINSYNHNKYAYEKLNEQQKQYIEETKLTRQEFDNMSTEEKEIFFKCMI